MIRRCIDTDIAVIHTIINMAATAYRGVVPAADWAIRLYERHGFRLVDTDEKNALLTAYWRIPLRQREASVVLIYGG